VATASAACPGEAAAEDAAAEILPKLPLKGVIVISYMGRHILDAAVGGDDARPFLAAVSKANELHADFFS
jgi:hypothetical protein